MQTVRLRWHRLLPSQTMYYAVKTHLFLGEKTLVDTAKRFGISTEMAAVPSLALGTSGVRVIEMANAYSLFANGGKKVHPDFD